LDRTYSADEFARIQEGHVPQRMEDKWFAFYEVPWLYLHRSWTGYGVYQVRFESTDGVDRVAEVLVSRDPEQYRSTDGAFDAIVLAIVLDGYAGRDTQAAWEQFKALQQFKASQWSGRAELGAAAADHT